MKQSQKKTFQNYSFNNQRIVNEQFTHKCTKIHWSIETLTHFKNNWIDITSVLALLAAV